MEVGVWRDVKVLGVGNVVRVFFARALVRGDVDPHSKLYTAVDTPAEAAWLCVCVCV